MAHRYGVLKLILIIVSFGSLYHTMVETERRFKNRIKGTIHSKVDPYNTCGICSINNDINLVWEIQ